ncbi:hypothetical protein [Halalkalibacter hemicellulosilyticus]|nr:hypothetical protein [Halalkalibacter hemicellulosilyticus]
MNIELSQDDLKRILEDAHDKGLDQDVNVNAERLAKEMVARIQSRQIDTK